jgi:hypothetical protein
VSEKLWKLSVKENRYLPMVTLQIKSEIIRAIEDLPDDATVEDAMERLYFLAKIERGLEQSESGGNNLTRRNQSKVSKVTEVRWTTQAADDLQVSTISSARDSVRRFRNFPFVR